MPIPTLTPPANPKIGDVIGSASGYSFNTSGLTCNYDIFPERINVYALNSSGYDTGYTHYAGVRMKVYSTSLSGVGFAVKGQVNGQAMYPLTESYEVNIWSTTSKPRTLSFSGTVYFVVTGPITGGSVRRQSMASYGVREDIAATGFTFRSAEFTVSPPLKPTCSVTTPSVSLPLGRVTTVRFSGVGSNAGSVTQNISLNCAGGGGSTRDILMTVTDQTNPANRTNVLSLTTASDAQGVALQLLHKSHLISYGADSATIGNPNQWLTGSSGNGTYTIPITARYIQTRPDMVAGTANGLATFTMAYR